MDKEGDSLTITLRTPSPVPSIMSSSDVATLTDCALTDVALSIQGHLDTTTVQHLISNSTSTSSSELPSALPSAPASVLTSAVVSAAPTPAIPSSSLSLAVASAVSTNSSSTSLSSYSRASKRSSSTSNDLLYERDRFRARLQTLNGSTSLVSDLTAACAEDNCEVCDEVDRKTKKLGHMDTAPSVESAQMLQMNSEPTENARQEALQAKVAVSLNDPISPLDPSSTFFKSLPDREFCDVGIKTLNYTQLHLVFHWYFNKPLPPTETMFPWLHGLHKENFAQKQFFFYQHQQRLANQGKVYSAASFEDITRKPDNVRFLMTINANANVSNKIDPYLPILKNNVQISEILQPIDVSKTEMAYQIRQLVIKLFQNATSDEIDAFVSSFVADCLKVNHLPIFLSLDPDYGVSLRNFHIQVAKLATFADFIVYQFANKDDCSLSCSIARVLWLAQRGEAYKQGLNLTSVYNIYVLSDIRSSQELVTTYEGLFTVNPSNTIPSALYAAGVAIPHQPSDANGSHFDDGALTSLSIWDGDYRIKERLETTAMSSATRINKNVWVGNVWDFHIMLANIKVRESIRDEEEYEEHKAIEFNHDSTFKNIYCDPKSSVIVKDLSTLANASEALAHLNHPRANWRLLVHCYDNATFPDLPTLANLLFKYTISLRIATDEDECHIINFPPSGSVGLGNCKVDNLMSIINLCKLLYLFLSSKLRLPDVLSSLIYCSDGFTELSLLVLCYLIYSENIRLDEAMIKLHLEYERPFYIFNSDVQILRKLERLLRKFSPADPNNNIVWGDLETISNSEINDFLLGTSQLVLVPKLMRLGYIANDSDEEEEEEEEKVAADVSKWVEDVEGSIPSRILPYLYLGSLKHANNLTLMNKLGISHIISAGEHLDWLNGYKFKAENDITIESINEGNIEIFTITPKTSKCKKDSVKTVMKLNHLQDDGIDELSSLLSTVLEYINEKYEMEPEGKILVHCRVGVSRSATIVISEVMRRLNVDLARAYLYVRVRRLNIVIQPNLRFMYELFKWEEKIKEERRKVLSEGNQLLGNKDNDAHGTVSGHNKGSLREIDWFVMCREIMRLNISYLQG